jgi:endonuclease/exonuclease/phosphatase family metal-dependent hydrolase
MTWNIAAGHGDLGRIAQVIRSIDPDVVALQEVDVKWSERSAFVDQADSLSKFLHMNVRFAPIYDLPSETSTAVPGIGSRRFGVAMLSRYPVVSWKNHEITRLSTQEQNPVPAKAPGFLETILDVNGTQMRVFSTHLDYRADPSVREKQVADMMEIIGQSTMPTILAGDLNATPAAAELTPLMSKFRDAASTPDGGEKTYPAINPARRIDYVLVSKELTVKEVRIAASDASDHRPVMLTMTSCSK